MYLSLICIQRANIYQCVARIIGYPKMDFLDRLESISK